MKCLFDQWYDNEVTNLGSFTLLIFQAYVAASNDNREKLRTAFPEWFTNVKSL